jgi:predicted amidohydrolase
MRAGVVQFRPRFGDVCGNLERMMSMLAQEEADLFVLPELATSGYTFESREEAASMALGAAASEFDGLAALAGSKGATVVVGFPELGDDGLFNSSMMLTPEGTRHVYRKVQLFYDEKRVFDPGGRTPEVFDVGGVRLGMMICFDWIFPEIARTLALRGADVLCHCANLVLPFCQDAMITRCVENRLFAITSNRVGTEKRAGHEFTFTGRSQIIAPRGDVLVRAGADGEDVFIVEFDHTLARDKSVTEFNDLLADRRPTLYDLD